MTFEFFAYWNGAQIRDLLEAMVAIVGTGDFIGLMQSVALAGFLSVITVCALRYRGLEVMSFFIAVLLFYTVTIVPKATVIVRDDRATQVYPVDHVPLGLAFLASTTSHVGHWLTESFESAFSSADADRFSRFGMVFPQRALNALLAAGPVTPQGRLLVSGFNRHCVVPELIDYPEKLNAIVESGNLWQTLSTKGWVNPARRTPGLDGSWITCDVAVTTIENHLNHTELPAIKRQLAMKLVPDHLDPSTVVASALPQAESILLGLSQTLSNSIKHSVFLNTLDEDLASVAALSNNPLAVATKLAKAQGNLASELNYRTMSQIAQDTLPKVRNALQFVILAAFPLILVMVVATGHMAASILRNYLTLLIWIELWAPISAVINYLMIHVDAHPMNQIVAQYGANSMMAATLIREMGASSQAIAGYLMILAPVIAFAIAKGSDIASAQMVGSMMAPAQSAAQSQGATLAQGNISLGNSTWGNVSSNNIQGNKADLSSSLMDSSVLRTASAYGSVTRTGDGLVTGMTATDISTGVSSSVGLGEQQNSSAHSNHSNSTSYSDAIGGLRQFMTQTQDKSMASFANQLNTAILKHQGLSEQSSESTSQSQSLSTTRTSSLEGTLSNSEQVAFKSHLLGSGLVNIKPENNSTTSALRTTLSEATPSTVNQATKSMLSNPLKEELAQPNDFKGGAHAELSIRTGQQLIDTVTQQSGTQNQAQRQQAYQTLLSATRQIAASTQDSAIRQAANAFEAQLTSAYQMASSLAFNQTASMSAATQVGQISQQDIRTLMNANPEAMHKAIETFGTAEKAQAALFHSAAARSAFAQQLQNDQVHQPYQPTKPNPLSLSDVDAIASQHKDAFKQELTGHFEQAQSAHQHEAFATQTHTIDRVVGTELPTQTIENIREKMTNRMSKEGLEKEEALTQDRGNVLAAAALYNEKQKGISTVISNALMGGLTYSSPENYSNALQEKAQASPANAQSLQKLGEQSAPIRIEDFEKAFQSPPKEEMSTPTNNDDHVFSKRE